MAFHQKLISVLFLALGFTPKVQAERCIFDGTTEFWKTVTVPTHKNSCRGLCPYYLYEKMEGGADELDECIAFGIMLCKSHHSSGIVKFGRWTGHKEKVKIDRTHGCSAVE